MTRHLFIRLSALLTLIVLVVQAVWAISMPGFRGPDEPHHVNSILRLASGGGWPKPGDAMVDTAILDAGRESGTVVPSAETFAGIARTKLGNDSAEPNPDPPYPTSFRNVAVTPHENRSAVGEIQRVDPDSVEVDQMSQHPPVYYAGGAAVVNLFDLTQQPWDRMLLGLRLYGIALTIPLVPALIYGARRLGARRTWAVAAGFLPLGIPNYLAITAAVTNDTLAIGTGALVIAVLIKAGTEPITRTTTVLVGASLGLALWSKGLLLAFGLALILVFLLKKDEPWRRRIAAVLASGTMSLAIGWWWIHNIIRYGVIQPSGFPRTVSELWDESMADIPTFFSTAVTSLSTSFFSAFGWLESDFDTVLTITLTVLLIAAVAWGAVCAGRRRRTAVAVLSPIVGVVVLLLAESWSTYQGYGTIAGVQGRYLYPLIAALGVVVLGMARFRGKAIVIFAAVNLAVSAYGFVFFLNSAYPGYPWIDFTRYSLVTGLSQVALTLVIELLVFAIIAAFILAATIGLVESRQELSVEERAIQSVTIIGWQSSATWQQEQR